MIRGQAARAVVARHGGEVDSPRGARAGRLAVDNAWR